jgi:hypothetical protein
MKTEINYLNFKKSIMKNSIKTIGALVFILFTILACKKTEDDFKVEEKEQKYSFAMKVSSAKGEAEEAIIIGTKAELEKALSAKSGSVYLKRIAEKNNVFIPVTGTVTDGPQPVDLNKLCWDEINAYYSANIATWQQSANQTCENVYVCITCPNTGLGLFVLYAISPNSVRCATVAEFTISLSKFNFNNDELESESVANFIKSK